MNRLDWIDPPRDYRDIAVDIARELHANQGKWARVLEDSTEIAAYERELQKHGIEVRLHSVREKASGHPAYLVWTQGDLYARAPKEAE